MEQNHGVGDLKGGIRSRPDAGDGELALQADDEVVDRVRLDGPSLVVGSS